MMQELPRQFPQRPVVRRQAGFSILVVLVGIVVVASLATGMILAVPQRLDELRRQEARMQTQLIGKSAWLHAQHVLAQDASYEGGHWTLAKGELGRPEWSADVRVSVAHARDRAECKVSVVLRGTNNVTVRWQQSFRLPQEKNAAASDTAPRSSDTHATPREQADL